MAQGGSRDVGRAQISIFGDDSPFQRTLRSLAATVIRPVTAQINAQGAEVAERTIENLRRELERLSGETAEIFADMNAGDARAELKNLEREAERLSGRIIDLSVDVDSAAAQAELAALRTTANALLRDITMNIDVDAAGATAQLAAAGAATTALSNSAAGLGSIFSGLSGRFVLIAGLVGVLLAALAPLMALVLLLGAGIMALVAGFGLLAGAIIPTIVSLGKKKAADEAAKAAAEQHQQSVESLTQAEEQYADTQERVADQIEATAEALQDAEQMYRRTRAEAEQRNREAARQVVEQQRSLSEAVRNAAQANEDASEQHAQALESLSEAHREGAERIADATDSYRESIRGIAVAQREAQRAVQESIRAYREEQQTLREVVQDARQQVEDAVEAYEDSIDRVRDSEQRLADTRRDLIDTTAALADAQESLNDAVEDEPLRQEELALDVQRRKLNILQTQQRLVEARNERAEAALFGDMDRVRELDLEIAELQLQQRENEIGLTRAEEERREARRKGTDELRAARERVEDLWRQQQESIRAVHEAERDVVEARQEMREAFAGISLAQIEAGRQIAEQQKAVFRAQQGIGAAQRQGARQVREAIRESKDRYQDLLETQQEVARSIEDAQEQVRDAAENMARIEAEGVRNIRAQTRALRQAETNARQVRQEGLTRIREAYDEVTERQEEFRETQVTGNRDVQEALNSVEEAQKNVNVALGEMNAKSRESAQVTPSQVALLAALKSFYETYKTSFAGANDRFNWFAVDVIRFFEQTLPFLGGIAEQTLDQIGIAWDELTRQWTEPAQVQIFRDFFERIPKLSADFVTTVGNFLTGLFNILEVAQPHYANSLERLAELSGKFLDWTQSPQGQAAVNEFFNRTMPTLATFFDILGKILRNLWVTFTSPEAQALFVNVMEMLGAISDVLPLLRPVMGVINGIIDLVQWLVPDVLSPWIIGIGLAMGAFVLALAGLAYGVHKIFQIANAGWDLFGLKKDRQKTNIHTFGDLTKRTMGRVRGWIVGAASGFAAFGRWAGRAARSMGRAIQRGARGVRNTIVRWLDQALSWTRQWSRRMGRQIARPFQSIGRVLQGVYRAVTRTFGQIGQYLAGQIRVLRFRLAGLLERMRIGISNFIKWVRGWATSISRFIGSVLRSIGQAVGRLPGWVGRVVQGAGRFVSGAVRSFAPVVAFLGRWFGPGSRIGRLIARMFGSRGVLLAILRGFAGRFGLGALFGPAGIVLSLLLEFVDEIVAVLDSLAEAINDGLQSLFGFRLDWFGPWAKRKLKALLGEGVYNAISEFVTADLSELVDMTRKWLVDAFNWIGDSMVWGWLKGMAGRAGDFLKYIWDLCMAAWKTAKDFFKPGSPSKLMVWLGETLGEGLARGVRNTIGSAVSAAKEMSEKVSGAIATQAKINVEVDGSGASLRRPVSDVGTAWAEAHGRNRVRDAYMRALADRGRESMEPMAITLPIYVGGKKIDERIVEVVRGEAREAVRSRSNSPGGGSWGMR